MTRTAAREVAVQLSFMLAANPGDAREALDTFFDPDYYASLGQTCETFAVYPDEEQLAYIRGVAEGVDAKREELDAYIQENSKNWKIRRISPTAMAVMRVAVYEMLHVEDVPPAAAINEAVELAKGYDEPETVAFVNGVLGAVYRTLLGEPEEAAAPAAEPEV